MKLEEKDKWFEIEMNSAKCIFSKYPVLIVFWLIAFFLNDKKIRYMKKKKKRLYLKREKECKCTFIVNMRFTSNDF